MQTVVLAAGLGKRLSPVTDDRSKAMVPVAGRPLVDLAIAPLVKCGLTDFIFVIGPQDFEIRRRFDNNANRDRSVRFVVQEQRLGMAHALAVAAPYLDGPFMLTACDSLIGENHVADLLSAHSESSAVLSLMEVAPERVCRSAAVELDGDTVRRIVEKPASGDAPSNTVSLPHYILPHTFLELLTEIEPSPRGEIELQSAIQSLIDRGGNVVGVRTDSRRQVSNPDDLLRLNLEVLGSVGAGHFVNVPDLDPTTVLNAPFLVEDGVSLGGNCVIGPNAYLERGCVIGDGAVVRDSVILRNAVVAGGQRVRGGLLS